DQRERGASPIPAGQSSSTCLQQDKTRPSQVMGERGAEPCGVHDGDRPAPRSPPSRGCVRERRGSVSWLEAATLAFPPRSMRGSGLCGENSPPSGPDRSTDRASYSGGAAPDSHRLPKTPFALSLEDGIGPGGSSQVR